MPGPTGGRRSPAYSALPMLDAPVRERWARRSIQLAVWAQVALDAVMAMPTVDACETPR